MSAECSATSGEFKLSAYVYVLKLKIKTQFYWLEHIPFNNIHCIFIHIVKVVSKRQETKAEKKNYAKIIQVSWQQWRSSCCHDCPVFFGKFSMPGEGLSVEASR